MRNGDCVHQGAHTHWHWSNSYRVYRSTNGIESAERRFSSLLLSTVFFFRMSLYFSGVPSTLWNPAPFGQPVVDWTNDAVVVIISQWRGRFHSPYGSHYLSHHFPYIERFVLISIWKSCCLLWMRIDRDRVLIDLLPLGIVSGNRNTGGLCHTML